MQLHNLLTVGAFSLLLASCLGAEEDGFETPADGEAVETATSALTVANLTVGEYLFPGQGITSSQCYYRLRMQGDGNLVIYSGGGSGAKALWASHTTERFIGAYAVLQRDGNFVLYNKWEAAVWATHTNYLSNPRLAMQNDGNLVVYEGSKAYWSTHTVVGPHSGPCSAVEQSESTLVEKNFNRPGADYKNFATTEGFHACGTACAAEARCAAFTYVPSGIQNATKAMCWLKEQVPPGLYDPDGMISGVKKKLQ